MINKAILLGTLGADPDLRYTAGGDPIANISVATNEKWKGKDGQQKEHTEWHRVTFFGKLAEVVGKYLKKGSKVYIEGKIKTQKYQAKDGTDRYSTSISVDSFSGVMKMLDSKPAGTQQPAQNHQQPMQQPAQNYQQSNATPRQPEQRGFDNDFDDDIPF